MTQAPTLTSWPGAVVVAVLITAVLACGWALYARAVRVDRLHRQVLGARATLEAQLLHRAQAAADLASCGALDPASGLLLARAAHDALEAEGPIVHDGLDPVPRLDAPPPGPQRGEGFQAAGGRGSGRGRTTGAPEARGQGAGPERSVVESDLSRVLRTVLDEPTRAELTDPRAAAALARLDKACSRLVLARRFHNTHVSQARSLRSQPVVRILHLAGHAPMPLTFDADDETRPEPGAPAAPGTGPGRETQR